ncbi:serine/threonine protein kinase [Lentzea sp. NBRC 105346]|uniref:serine/threonine-protein kinase n=1 Tax=Lentzea sp. NBRC 105346 TaxID=3032205 RepID=UPI0024A43258|nr:serine/threonine-protein kinase [Lentzea sp. NBRC 105346]GLZ30003.1 serine/threonine protein kinase [Lentzea sp. NBRC 105346]
MLIADRYEVDDLPLGTGGMSAVHRGHDKHLDRRVAVKLLRLRSGGPDDELAQRFVREARILARFEHPGVPTLHDFGMHEHSLFQVMQYVEGVTIADLVSEHGPLPVPWAVTIAAQTCAVLFAAHRLSICHRDLKPNNLMLCPDGGVKVLDFGLAVLRDSDVAQFTRAGQIVGTPAYMAPEQIQRGFAEPRSDLYALGCVLHEMLTGQQLFTGPTAYAVFDRHVKEEPPRVPGISDELNDLLLQLLEKHPDARPANAVATFNKLGAHTADLPPLPGFLEPGPSPVRMYAGQAGIRFTS